MARVTKPIEIPAGVSVEQDGTTLSVKGKKGQLELSLHPDVESLKDATTIRFEPRQGKKTALPIVGTTRSLVVSMIKGVNEGFQKKLELVGVGYRAQAKGDVLNITLGFSHPINYAVPVGITIETPSQTEIFVKGIDKQKVGQVAAEIRAFRPPEPYKGKGVKYSDEVIIRKEAKKK